ncbi:hypothetical protein NLI96_g12622 [Meripilus lineatus]|uniref:FH2 domain-containing protein n=1 Tax=Meripilus lineatus TaxID=2056292 RepID=A0AAD5YC81_9APHY|nr:hypothetical protein NLI96_g12622 [Physisporinus lineatus]
MPPPPPPPPGMKGSHNPPAPGGSRVSMLGANLNNLLSARKDILLTPSTKMKQLQWDKLPQQIAAKTIFRDDETEKEHEWIKKLQIDGVWMEMEEDFKAKQLVINLMAKQKRAELKSVLDPQTKKRVEILIQTVKKLEPEEIALKIKHFDQSVCTEVFLSELKPVLPNPEQVGKLNVYRNAEPEELAGLHPSDRLMVQLIKIERLGPRIEGMLYRRMFDETWALLDDSARKLSEAGKSLLDAKKFKELLSLILLIGNYMNGTGVKGGAFGFRVSSINKLVDTKSLHNTTLLHFLERTVAKHFPEIEGFLDELSAPAEAYRVNLQDVRKSLSELQSGLKRIRTELKEHFSDIEQVDRYGKQMWSFVGDATSKLDDLKDDVNYASNTFTEVATYYGEDEKNVTSSEFYGIFKTFVTSYKKCQGDNQAIADERMAMEKRKQAAEEAKASRQKAADEAASQKTADSEALDSLLEKLRAGDGVGRKARRPRPSAANKAPSPLSLNTPSSLDSSSDDPANLARDMLARLKSDGFEALMPSTPTASSSSRRRTRRKGETSGFKGIADELSTSQFLQLDNTGQDESADESMSAVGDDADASGSETPGVAPSGDDSK